MSEKHDRPARRAQSDLFDGDQTAGSEDLYVIDATRMRLVMKRYGLAPADSDLVKEINELVVARIKAIAAQQRKSARAKRSADGASRESAADVLTREEIRTLPAWVSGELSAAHVVGNSHRVIEAGGKRYHLDNKLNDLSGSEWTFFLRSVINTNYSTGGSEGYAHRIRRIHPTPKPPQLMADIIRFFTKQGGWVLDFFMGVGGTLLGASIAGRNAVGIELNRQYVEAYHRVCRELGLPRQDVLVGDSLEILKTDRVVSSIEAGLFDLICIDPPYGNMMAKPKTGDKRKRGVGKSTPFTESDKDLGNLEPEAFLARLKGAVVLSLRFLKRGGYVVVFTKDFQPSGKDPNLLHADVIARLNEIPEMYYAGMKIWVDETIRLYPYGYPHKFVPHQLHQYIIVFRKE